MTYFERIEQLGQMNIFHYLLLDKLSVDECVTFQDVKITRQSRFFEVETDRVHEVVQSVEEVFGLLGE
jgi:hypothetical protein